MQLEIKPYHKNNFQIGGILIRNPSVAEWLKGIQEMRFSLNETRIFPVPDVTPNSIWGCLIIPNTKINKDIIGKNELCQLVSPNLFIPENAILKPALSNVEIEKLFGKAIHIIHPEFGFAELTEELDLESLLIAPKLKTRFVTKPQNPVFYPKHVKSFQLQAIPPEEILKNLEDNLFPKKEKMLDKPLNIFEKAKLAVYNTLFIKKKDTKQNDKTANKIPVKTISSTEKKGWFSKIESLIKAVTKKENEWANKIQWDFEDLDKRNQKQLDKLMELLKKNPSEALKYAIPLDEAGGTRGGEKGSFDLLKRWFELSLTGSYIGGVSGSGGSVNLGDRYYDLRNQYTATAEDLIKQKKFHEAAFVYMKLLKNPFLAAQALESGNYYQEAASIYLKHAHNKNKAAECYEKGKLIMEAIGLYKEMNQDEKVGDLYLSISKRKEADIYYEKVVEEYKSKNQFVKASLIYKEKMNNAQAGQLLLLKGWRENKDAFNCLNNYFSNIKDVKVLGKEINNVYENELSSQNRQNFLNILKYEFNRKNELADAIKDMAYKIVAEHIPDNPSVVTELKFFNPKDKELLKDAMRFKLKMKK